MAKVIDVAGQKFGRLTAISNLGRVQYPRTRSYFWLCKCDCGNESVVGVSQLRDGSSLSCGCLRAERLLAANTKHGLRRHPEYQVWKAMIERCTHSNSRAYRNYGARGITVCSRWLDCAKFFEDMGPRPTGTSLERINNDAGYSPENCKWATLHEQSRNKRSNVKIEFDGETKCLTDWANEYGIHPATLFSRIRRKIPISDSLNLPLGQGKRLEKRITQKVSM